MPTISEGKSEGTVLYSMNADLVLVKLATGVRNLSELRQTCSKFIGLKLATAQGPGRLNAFAALLKDEAVTSGVPFGYRLRTGENFVDFADEFASVNTVLNQANRDGLGPYTNQKGWTTESKDLLVGVQKNSLATLSYEAVQAVICERVFTCLDTGSLDGESPVCTANPCTLPSHTGTNFTQCFGLKTTETCNISCLPNRQKLTTTYDLAEAFAGPMVAHSYVPQIPTNGIISLALFAEVTTEDNTWDLGSLGTFGGATQCCSGALQFFSQSNRQAGCNPDSGLFAFGFGSACDKSDKPLLSQCKYQKEQRYLVRIRIDGSFYQLFVDNELVASGRKSFQFVRTDATRGFLAFLLVFMPRIRPKFCRQ